MPVQSYREKGKCFMRWGSNGAKYFYSCGNKIARDNAKKKAEEQGRAARANGYQLAIEKVSYGYSGTITNHEQQLQALDYISKGIEVFILSSRDNPEGMYLIADHLGIPHENVFATGDNDLKIAKIKELRVDIHYDTNPYVLEALGDIGKAVEPAKTKNIEVIYKAV